MLFMKKLNELRRLHNMNKLFIGKTPDELFRIFQTNNDRVATMAVLALNEWANKVVEIEQVIKKALADGEAPEITLKNIKYITLRQ